MSPLAAAVIQELHRDPDALRDLADALAPFMTTTPATPRDDAWLDARAASEYLGLPLSGKHRRPHALHKLTAARVLDFEQECPGGRLYFRRSALDAYRRGERHR